MKIALKESSDLTVKLTINSQISFANSIRRILLGEVPGTAIDIIEIKENRSVLADEMLANRLGQVPIFHKDELLMKEECDCDNYCRKCSIQLTLNVSNNNPKESLAVTGKDLVADCQGVVCHDSLIVKLAPGQFLDMKCIARRGTPQQHSKFCPVTAVGFSYDRRNKHRDTKLWYEEDVKAEWPMINQTDEVDWKDCREVEMEIEVVEGCGNPKEILLKALEIFRDKMISVLESIE